MQENLHWSTAAPEKHKMVTSDVSIRIIADDIVSEQVSERYR